MAEEKQAQLPPQQMQDRGPRCATCAAFPRLALSILDTRTSKTFRLYRCNKCGERVGDD